MLPSCHVYNGVAFGMEGPKQLNDSLGELAACMRKEKVHGALRDRVAVAERERIKRVKKQKIKGLERTLKIRDISRERERQHPMVVGDSHRRQDETLGGEGEEVSNKHTQYLHRHLHHRPRPVLTHQKVLHHHHQTI